MAHRSGAVVSGELENLYRRERAGLVRLAYLLVGSQAVAEDLVHEAFAAVLPKDRISNPGGYLRQTVVNLARKHHRRADVERRHAPVPPGPALAPELDETWDLLWALPERQRHALVLRFYEDMSIAGVAEALGCPVGTAKSLLHRGLATLREELEP